MAVIKHIQKQLGKERVGQLSLQPTCREVRAGAQDRNLEAFGKA